MSSNPRPKVFIGSSTESLPILRVVQRALAEMAEVVAWTADENWEIGRFTLENLISRAREFDFAVLIFGSDDEVISRGKKNLAPRDNVVFELGLFMSQLDRDRTLVVTPRNVKILSDLSGLNPGYYQLPTRRKREAEVTYERRITPGLAKVIQQLGERVARGPRPAIEPAPRSGPRDVYDVGRALEEIIGQRKRRLTRVRNLALDMEATWGIVWGRVVSPDSGMQNMTWQSLMVDPDGVVMKTMASDSVSRKMAATRIKEMRKACPKVQASLRERKVTFDCRAYTAVPMLHGFLIDDDVLLLSLCNVSGGRLNGAATPYWHFEKNSAHAQSRHLFDTYVNWFQYYWETSRNVWPT